MNPQIDPPGRFLTVAVSGPTGSGKTTFAGSLASRMKAILIPETVPRDLLVRCSKLPAETCFELQREIVQGRLQAFTDSAGRATLVLDRTVSEDRCVFFRLHQLLGFLSPLQVAELDAIASRAEELIGPLTAVVYLFAQPEVLLSRMEQSGTPAILRNTLAQQIALYECWRTELSIPWVPVDTTDISLRDVPTIVKWLAETIPTVTSGSLPRNDCLCLRWRNPTW